MFFTFSNAKTLEDQNIVPVAEYYIDDFESLRIEISQTVEELKAKFADLENIETKDGAQEKANRAEANAKDYTATHAKNKDVHITADERKTWNSRETTEGAQKKANKAFSDAKSYTDDHAKNMDVHISTDELKKWNAAQLFKITADSGTQKINLTSGTFYEALKDVGTVSFYGTNAVTDSLSMATCIAAERYASAHYFVDRKEVQLIIPENEVAYHAHENNGCYVSFLKPNANKTAIGVEMCVEKNGKIHSETVQNAAELVADLCKRYGLSTNKIVRHYDVTNKNCPAPWVSDSSQLTAFRKKVDSLLGNKTVSNTTAPTSQSSKSTGTILKKGSSGSKVKALQKRLISAGFSLPKYGADGSYGNETVQAIKALQKKSGITADGIYGPATEKAFAVIEAKKKNHHQAAKNHSTRCRPASIR